MPVDKFGHTDIGGTATRVIAGGVTLSQVNASFLRMDGANPATGDLNMNGRVIKGLPITNNRDAGMDVALSWGQAIDLITNHDDIPSNDNHLTNKKYVDQSVAGRSIAARDYVSGMRVSPGSLVRNTTSGITYRFEGTAGAITAAPALSPNWRPTTGAAICMLTESELSDMTIKPAPIFEVMLKQLTTASINTDSAYTWTDGKITIPRTGVYRLGGYATFAVGDPRSGCTIKVRIAYAIARLNSFVHYNYRVGETAAHTDTIFLVLPSVYVPLAEGDQLGMRVTCSEHGDNAGRPLFGVDACALQAEFLY